MVMEIRTVVAPGKGRGQNFLGVEEMSYVLHLEWACGLYLLKLIRAHTSDLRVSLPVRYSPDC